MFFEYFRLTGMDNSSFSLDFISRVFLLVFAGLLLALIGFKIKGVWGAAWALAGGVVWFLYNEGIIRF
jgi:urea transporter